MKRILTCSALLMFVVAGFTSCKKDYTCYCYNDYVDVTTKESRYHTDSKHTVEAVDKDEAKSECKYYQTHTWYLQYEVYINHYCDITEGD